MSLPPVDNPNLPTTVTGTLRYALKLYEAIHEGSPMDPNFQPCVSLTITLFLRLWSHIVSEGIFRKGESLREMTDLTLELIPVPFYLGKLSEKRMVSSASLMNNDNNSGEVNDGRKPQQKQDQEITDRVARSNSRVQSLLACNDFLFKYLAVCVELKLCTEKDVATKPFSAAIDRTTRLEISKKRFAFEDEVKDLDNKVRFARERAKRNARIMREDERQERLRESRRTTDQNDDDEHNGENDSAVVQQERKDDLEEEFLENILADDDDYQETRRERHIKMAEWAILESYSLLQGNARELEILGSLTDNEKKKAIADFQRNLNSTSNSRIPGVSGSSSATSSMYNYVTNLEREKNDDMTNKVEDSNYTVLPGGKVVPFGSVTTASASTREQIKQEAFMNRNNPTMTLGEYADMEMAYMKKMQDQEARGKKEHEEENERLGEDGVEERERQKAAAWDDWKDANPSVGITSKGNYS